MTNRIHSCFPDSQDLGFWGKEVLLGIFFDFKFGGNTYLCMGLVWKD